jgi:S1-C subfamily serine protease
MDEDINPLPTTSKSRWLTWMQTMRVLVKRIWPFAVVFIAAFLGVYIYNFLYPPPTPPSQNSVNENIRNVMASATPEPAYSTRVYQAILPSIVYIESQTGKGRRGGTSVGTGVVVNLEGDILTAFHVVDNAERIEVHFSDGSNSIAEIISAEPENDIAVLHPTRPPGLIVPAVLGNPGAMRVGDEAFAVGNPLGLVASMSAGVISGFNRSIPINDSNIELQGLIQFDTAVNPGNSGGPLLNRRGQVIGIVTALANPSDQNFFVGIGFAVPIGTAVTAAGGIEY